MNAMASVSRLVSYRGALPVGQQRELVEQRLAARHLDPLDAGEPLEGLLERMRVQQFLPRGERVRIRTPRRVGGTGQVALDVREARFAVACEVSEPLLGQRVRPGDQFGAAPH